VPRQLPNAITIVRILCAPVFLWMLLADGGADGALRWWAAVLFIVAIASDGIDGYIARRYDIVTDLGKLLDPIADKVLIGGALVGLSLLGELWWWVTIVILVREFGITIFRFIALRDRVIPATWSGKIKTIVQAIGLSLMLFPFWLYVGEWYRWAGWGVVGLALVLTVYSGAHFFWAAWKLRERR